MDPAVLFSTSAVPVAPAALSRTLPADPAVLACGVPRAVAGEYLLPDASLDEQLLAAMEARLDAECGADAFNDETFGTGEVWHFGGEVPRESSLASSRSRCCSHESDVEFYCDVLRRSSVPFRRSRCGGVAPRCRSPESDVGDVEVVRGPEVEEPQD